MPRTPDSFPGERIDDSLRLLPTSSLLSTQPGEMYYVSGSGFAFNEEGVVKHLGELDVVEHENLNTFVHDVVLGTTDVTYNVFGIDNVVVWEDDTRTNMLQSYDVSYTRNIINAVTSSLYTSGSLSEQVVETPVYDVRHRIISIDRTRVI